MASLNHLIMAAICGFLLWFLNLFILSPLINLGLNCLLLIMLIIYLMQFLGVIRELLPAIKLF
ncbi:Uncharacterised protein [Legionella hackeliae]|uniref:Transmembrane protein n=1 Tax=Legionella hackeliae TaxID=449 RepID=A0A0A8UKG5_LEGHA|nr:hypothetical protein Lhac_1756 [Legionella hackeliae]CEK09193.1 conserved protein of unknown function [Legionella hackeliae]STX49101.1 Uncharacterised protein [Legionella hackeliae]